MSVHRIRPYPLAWSSEWSSADPKRLGLPDAVRLQRRSTAVTAGHPARGLLTISFRPARPSEVDDLRALVMRSMGHGNHPPEYLAAARELMSLSSQDLRRDDAWVALVDGEVVGFYRISRTGGEAEIEEFHVEPRLIGRGVGRAMFEHAVQRAQRANARWLTWSTDGNALGFYIAMGGEVTGSVPSGIDGDEPLTSMRLDLHPTA